MKEEVKTELNEELQEGAENEPETAEQAPEEQNADALPFDELKQLINEHYTKITGLVRYAKEKDANVLTLSKQMQIYRDGVEVTLFKRVALELIGYREACRKSLRDLEGRTLTAQEAVKYIGYLKADFEDMLENLGISCSEDGVVRYNKKDIGAEIGAVKFKDVPPFEAIVPESVVITDVAGLAQYLQNCESALSAMLQNNVVLDSVVADYIAAASVYEQGLYQVVLYPVIRVIAKTYYNLSKRVDTLSVAEEKATETYAVHLTTLIVELEMLLEKCGVSIDGFVADTYDPKKQRILKMVETDVPELNGQVICRYTDCYTMEDKVIYLSKVDVYKTKKN